MGYTYSAIFYPDPTESNKNLVSVKFPDLPGCFTCGDGFDDALEMAEDALRMWLFHMEEENMDIPEPTPPRDININENESLSAVYADTRFYRNTNVSEVNKINFSSESNNYQTL